jgi:hypothetical protein
MSQDDSLLTGDFPMPRETTRQQNRNPRQQDWNSKRDRQYEHIEESQEEEGRSRGRAEEIAARTVNKQRARSGEARQQSKTSTEGLSAPQRGGLRSGHGPEGRTKDQLYADAKRQHIPGRSKMNKQELQERLGDD